MRKLAWFGVAVTLCVFAGWYILNAGAPGASLDPPPPDAAPVLADRAHAADVPIYRSGIGTVQAFNTVTVHARVDGELTRVAFTEGQDVKAGDLLAQIDPRPLQAALDQAVAAKVRDQALLENAKLDLQRYSNLVTKEFATRQSVDTQLALVHQYDAALQGDQAAIDNARVQLGYTTITAPLTGRTGIRLVDQGNIVHASDTTGLVVIAQLQPISVIFTLPETLLAQINSAMAAGPLTVEAWSEDDGVKLDDGDLMLIDNQIDQSSGTVRLKARFPNEAGQLWPGQFVNAHLRLETRRNGVLVAAQAVQRGANGTFVWVIKPDHTVELRPVRLGQIDRGQALIETGLASGEQVVTDGQYRLRPGTLVAVAGQPPQAAALPAGIAK